VDIHGLSLTATTNSFLQQNEVLNRYMTAVMELDKTNLSRNQTMLMDPFISIGGDEEVEALLNSYRVSVCQTRAQGS
jgi:hypothetical protein